MSNAACVRPADLRREFSQRLSDLYAREVPLYGELIEAVRAVNREVIRTDPGLGYTEDDVEGLSEERHGAIRLGRDDELATMADFFAVLGMHPVNTYDLSAAGAKAQPVLSTVFRPVDLVEIEVSPFRVFCSLLRPDDERFFDDAGLRERLHARLAGREIFSPRLRELIAVHQREGGLDRTHADAFLDEGLELFRWRGEAADRALYDELIERGLNIAADICCFPNPHLNHLTPNTLDIDALQVRMERLLAAEFSHLGAEMKNHIEGPPRREAPILLRQTSYKALTEEVRFDGETAGAHTARFGEIEQRGLALTPAGRALYDEALAAVEERRAAGEPLTPAVIAEAFAALPDDFAALRAAGLGYFAYEPTAAGLQRPAEQLPRDRDALVAGGWLIARPIRYEDFLPVSAAGIFASNLRQSGARRSGESPHGQADLEEILGRAVLDSNAMYAAQEASSLQRSYAALGVMPAADEVERLTRALASSPAARS